jgi:tetratricopeptide (TPR) repeat protein
LGQYTEAARSAEEAIHLAPNSPDGFRLRALALSRIATKEHGLERDRLAHEGAASAREGIRLAPRDPNGYLRLAEALRLTRNLGDADAAVQEALRLAPNSAATWVTASLVALTANNWETAITASRRALAIDPSNYAAMDNLGVALRRAGKRREGTKVLAEAARIAPDSTTARTNLSRAGVNVARIVIMVLLIPIGFLAHVGLVLYFVFALGSNALISRYPGIVLRMESWAAPLTLFFSRRDQEDDLSDPYLATEHENAGTGSSWSALEGRRLIGSPVVRFSAISAWSATAIMLFVLLAVPGVADRLVVAAVVVVFAALAMWPTLVLRRRRREVNGRR